MVLECFLSRFRDFVLKLDDVAIAAEDSSDIVIALVTTAQVKLP